MVMPPDWGGSCTVETLVAHYAAIAGHMPVMPVTFVLAQHGVEFRLTTLRAVGKRVAGFAAVKDDFCGEFARRISLMLYDRCAAVSGGQKQNHLNLPPYGCDGYLSTFVTFKPQVARAYRAAIERSDLAGAKDLIATDGSPFFDYMMRLPGGFDAGIHGALEVFGIAARWRRPPYYSLNDEEMEQLADFLHRLPPVPEDKLHA
jgi:dihydrodipicolinate synthase/N-acetylneuraminate lyase